MMKKASSLKKAAIPASALTVALIPQLCDADIITVGGDGGVGSVSVPLRGSGSVDVGGLLASPIYYRGDTSSYNFLSIGPLPNYTNLVGNFVRSAVSTSGNLRSNNIIRFRSTAYGSFGAILGSDDNWLPGIFNINGVNGGNPVYGWMHFRLSTDYGTRPELISFTYDSDATDATPFAKPVGGFSVSAIPEPSSLAGLALLACGAAGVRRRRQLAA